MCAAKAQRCAERHPPTTREDAGEWAAAGDCQTLPQPIGMTGAWKGISSVVKRDTVEVSRDGGAGEPGGR